MNKNGHYLPGVGSCLLLVCCLSAAAAEPRTFEERRHIAQALEDNSKTVFTVMHHVQTGVNSKGDALLEFLGGFAGFTVVWAIALGVLGVLLVAVTALACAEVARPLFRRRSSRQ